jgi:hypothetical protein
MKMLALMYLSFEIMLPYKYNILMEWIDHYKQTVRQPQKPLTAEFKNLTIQEQSLLGNESFYKA